MRKIIIPIVFLLLLLTSCDQITIRKIGPADSRKTTAFSEWTIPGTFIPTTLYVIGLGDSLTVGVGDELKKGGYLGRVVNTMDEWQGVKDVHLENLAKTGRRSDQLLTQLEDSSIQAKIKRADIIFLTIGGNDIMKVIKRDIFQLKVQPFFDELKKFEVRLDEIFSIIRSLNGEAIIVISNLYNPFTIFASEEPTELKEIMESWNEAIEVQTVLDPIACFVQVDDLFYSNKNMVYHTDFFHPNAKGYTQMAERYATTIEQCNLFELSNGELDM